MNPTKGRATAGEQKRPKTKIAQHKGPKRNIRSGKDAEVGDRRRKQEGGAKKM